MPAPGDSVRNFIADPHAGGAAGGRSCEATPNEAVNSTTPNAGSCFRHAGSNQFIFNLGTKNLTKPATYEVTASLYGAGGTVIASHTLAIGLR